MHQCHLPYIITISVNMLAQKPDKQLNKKVNEANRGGETKPKKEEAYKVLYRTMFLIQF